MAGKKLKDALKKIDRQKLYQPQEALELLKELTYAKFDETVEVHIRTGVDPRHADQVIRGSVDAAGRHRQDPAGASRSPRATRSARPKRPARTSPAARTWSSGSRAAGSTSTSPSPRRT